MTPETLRRLDVLFTPGDRESAKALLQHCESERLQFAALKVNDGKLAVLDHAVRLAQRDFRDLLMAADFGEVDAHLKWKPKPAAEPSEIDPPAFGAGIHESLATVLRPMGFERHGEKWSRGGEVPQTLELQTGLTSRIEVKFFLKATLEAERIIMLRLPKLPARMGDQQGYIFRARGNSNVLCAALKGDAVRYIEPLFQRSPERSAIPVIRSPHWLWLRGIRRSSASPTGSRRSASWPCW
jgi:hypothetical protein